jgi:hypothetical protein
MEKTKLFYFYYLKKITFILILLFIITLPNMIFAESSYSIYDLSLTNGEDESNLNLTWYSTSNTDSVAQVALKSDMSDSDFPSDLAETFSCTVESEDSGYYINKAIIENLESSTEYIYRLGDGEDNWTTNYYYTTGSKDTFNFIAVGDPQIGAGGTTSDTNNWRDTLDGAIEEFPYTSFIMSVGDQVNTNDSESQFTGFFSPEQLESIPLSPSLGNHDNGSEYTTNHFNLPNLSTKYGITSPGGADYYYTYGNALFMVLNSNNVSGTSHEAFIEEAISNNSDSTWRIVMFHHDIYGSGSHALESSVENLRASLFPVFDEYEIDIVLTGHDHSYTRSYVMKGDIPQTDQEYDENGSLINPDGTIYFTLNTASGSKYYSLNSSQASYVDTRMQVNVPTFSNISIDDNSLTFNTYRTDTMAQLDTCSIVKSDSEDSDESGDETSDDDSNEESDSDSSTESTIIEQRISSDIDDIEEDLSDGSIYSNSSDIELTYDSNIGNQIIGLRFNELEIPKESNIINAYIQFTCDETSRGEGVFTINGQASSNAETFTTESYNLSVRDLTSSFITWEPLDWDTVGESGTAQQTSDISQIVQEIVDYDEWSSNNSLAIIISSDDNIVRCAESYRGSSSKAPLIHIEYD